MPLNDEDCVYLAREIIQLLREYDPNSFELILGSMERHRNPREDLIELLPST